MGQSRAALSQSETAAASVAGRGLRPCRLDKAHQLRAYLCAVEMPMDVRIAFALELPSNFLEPQGFALAGNFERAFDR